MARNKIKVGQHDETKTDQLAENITGETNSQTQNEESNSGNEKPLFDFDDSENKAAPEIKPERDLSKEMSEIEKMVLNDYSQPQGDKPKRKYTRRGSAANANNSQTPGSEQSTLIIPGETIIYMTDIVFIGAIGWFDAKFSKEPMNTDLLKTDADETKRLTPLALAFAKHVNLATDPVSAYLGSMAALYFSKYMQIKAMMDRNTKQILQEIANANRNGANINQDEVLNKFNDMNKNPDNLKQ